MPVTRRERRGSSAVEAGLLVPVLFVLVLPAIDYAWYFTLSQSVVHAAQNGARAGSKVEGTDPVAAAEAEAANTLTTELGSTLAGLADVSATVVLTDAIRVDVTLPFDPLVGYLAMPPEIRSMHQMRLEHPE